MEPVIYSRSEHPISRANLSDKALKVLYRLKDHGFAAYIVGGALRDLLLGLTPKDFDVATDAHPEQINELFRNCRLIGRRFRLAHVHFGKDIIEVATFRGSHETAQEHHEAQVDDEGMILRDNVYGTLEEDVWRRDFTINALYYNIADFSLVDFAGAMEDLNNRVIRLIGDPVQRYREDPVRMLRAARFSAKLGFSIDAGTRSPIVSMACELQSIPPARLFDEVLKMFMGGAAVKTYQCLKELSLFEQLFPAVCDYQDSDGYDDRLLVHALRNTDERKRLGKPVTPAFLFAAILWEPVRKWADKLVKKGCSEHEALSQASDRVISNAIEIVAIPRRFAIPMREIWCMQPRFELRRGKRPVRFMNHPRFRAAFDFMLLRSAVGQADQELAEWWESFQQGNEQARTAMISRQQKTGGSGERKKRRRSPRKKSNVKSDPGHVS